MTSDQPLTGRVIIIEQEHHQEVSPADWTRFSVVHRLVWLLGTSESYSAEHPDVRVTFTPGRAEFGAGEGGEEDLAELAVAFLALFGGTMTISPLMVGAVRDECLRR